MPSNKNRYRQFREKLAEKIDYVELYTELGLEIVGHAQGTNGWIAAKSHSEFGGEDNNPSAGINIVSGLYKDFRTGDTYNPYDFMVAIGRATSWKDAQKQIAEKYDVKIPSVSKNHPEHGVEWQPWIDESAVTFCTLKPPITIEGLKLSGARMCTWHDQPAFAWPIWDDQLQIIGYYFLPRNGLEFRQGGKSRAFKYEGIEGGFVGTPGVRAIIADRHPQLQAQYEADPKGNLRNVFWCEGMTDLVAAYSMFPDREEFITNGNGAHENVTTIQTSLLKWSPVNVVMVADHDLPGFIGAHKRRKQLQQLFKAETLKSPIFNVRVVCPFDPKREYTSNDLRDWFLETAGQLGEDTPPDDMALITLGGQELYNAEDPEYQEEMQKIQDEEAERYFTAANNRVENLMKELRFRIYKVYEDGRFIVGCTETGRTSELQDPKTLSYSALLKLGGFHVARLISRNSETNGVQIATVEDVRDAIALSVSKLQTLGKSTVGIGIWRLEDEDDRSEHHIALVKQGNFYFPRGDELIEREGPNYGKYLADWNDKDEWFDQDLLPQYLKKARDPEWRKATHDEFLSHLGTWNWAYPNMDLICAGLTYATWLQSTWKSRPIVTLTGESASGKTELLEFLGSIFLGNCAPLIAASTAGLMQSIKYKSMPVMMDEIDAVRKQQDLFKTVRATLRGQRTLKGTADQTGKTYSLHHIPWFSGISFSTEGQADLNRMVQLHLLELTPEHELSDLESSKAYDLGHRILAATLIMANEVRDSAIKLMKMGVISRYRESHAVPVACLGAMVGLSLEETNAILDTYLDDFVKTEVQTMAPASDQDAVVVDILSATVRLPYGAPIPEPTVGMMITDPAEFAPFWQNLEPTGIAIKRSRENELFLAIDPSHIQTPHGLLGNTRWRYTGTAIRQLLKRFGRSWGVISRPVRLNGRLVRATYIPLDALRCWMSDKKLPSNQPDDDLPFLA